MIALTYDSRTSHADSSPELVRYFGSSAFLFGIGQALTGSRTFTGPNLVGSDTLTVIIAKLLFELRYLPREGENSLMEMVLLSAPRLTTAHCSSKLVGFGFRPLS